MQKEPVSIQDIVTSEIRVKDKYWFVIKKCSLTVTEKQDLAISCAEIVLTLYEKKHPGNKAPREAIQAAKDYLAGTIGIDELRVKRSAAYTVAYADADVADVYAATYAADAAAYAAASVDAADFITLLQKHLEDFIR